MNHAKPGPATMAEFSREVFQKEPATALELVLAENERIRLESKANGEVRVTDKGIEADTLDGLWRLAKMYWDAGLAPKGTKNVQALIIAMGHGKELGLSPLRSIQCIAVINGRPSLWGDDMLALCQQHESFDHKAFQESVKGTGDDRVALSIVRRKPDGNLQTKRFSVYQAKHANLWGKGVWTSYPERMLQVRARSLALRDTFADVLCGLHCAEEMRDVETPVSVDDDEPAPKLDDFKPEAVEEPDPAAGFVPFGDDDTLVNQGAEEAALETAATEAIKENREHETTAAAVLTGGEKQEELFTTEPP